MRLDWVYDGKYMRPLPSATAPYHKKSQSVKQSRKIDRNIYHELTMILRNSREATYIYTSIADKICKSFTRNRIATTSILYVTIEIGAASKPVASKPNMDNGG